MGAIRSRVAVCGVGCLASIKEKLTWFDLPGDQLVLDRRAPWDRCAGGVALVDLPAGGVASARVDRPMSVADSARIAASRAAVHPLWTVLAWCEGTVVVVVGSWAPELSGFGGLAATSGSALPGGSAAQAHAGPRWPETT